MKFAMALVEGQTEEAFIKFVLNPYLNGFNIDLTPIVFTTRATPTGPHYKGGIGSQFNPIQKQLIPFFRDSSVYLITTCFDFYRWPKDAPGRADLPQTPAQQQVEHLEQAWQQSIVYQNLRQPERFLPYLVLHEFEAILFTSPQAIAKRLGCKEQPIEKIRHKFPTPEAINHDDPPSKHLLALAPAYQKSVDGPAIAREISIDAIRADCPHFNQWLETMLTRSHP